MADFEIDSAITQIFISLPSGSQMPFLNHLRELCDTLEKSHQSHPDDLSNLLSGDNNDQPQ